MTYYVKLIIKVLDCNKNQFIIQIYGLFLILAFLIVQNDLH